MNRLTRLARGGVIAGVLALAAAAPTAAAQPTKDTFHDLEGFTIPADMACPFDVDGSPDFGFAQRWRLSDGSVKGAFHAHGAYVNDETGARYPTLDNFSFIQWSDSDTGLLHVILQGQAADSFLPGDVGPFGIVGEHGAFYDFVGRITFTIDPITGHVSQFSWTGTATDICAALS